VPVQWGRRGDMDCSAPLVAHVARWHSSLWRTVLMGEGGGCSEALEEDDGRVGRTAEKPPGQVQGFRVGRLQCTKMGQKARKMKINP
jgi:hypothetical protein